MSVTLLQPVELRAHYDRAFEHFIQQLTGRSDGPRLERLYKLADFRANQVAWGSSGPDRAIRAMDEGKATPAWFVALSPDDPTARTQQGIFATDWFSPSMVATCIRPDPITPEWAALGLVMGLEHLEAAVSGREPKFRPIWQHHAEDVRAYESELAAADVLSDGRFSAALQKTLVENRLDDGKQVAAFVRRPELWNVLRPLTMSVTETAALSPGEEAMRGGLCVIGLGTRAVESFAKDPESEFEQKIRFLQKMVPPPPRPG